MMKEVPTGRRWDRGGKCLHTGDMHKTETVDYAILLEGDRNLILDDGGEIQWNPGDVVVQRYVVDAGGKKLAAKGTPTLALVPKAPGADVRLMVDGAGRLWASLRVDPKAPGSAFFVIDRKALH